MMLSALKSPHRNKVSATRLAASAALLTAIVLAFVRPESQVAVAEFLAFSGLSFGLRDKATS
jgi:hypothetical protein